MGERNPARDWAIWEASCSGKTHAEIAVEFKLSRPRISQIVERMKGNVSVRARADVRADLAAELADMREAVAELARMDLPPKTVSSEAGIRYVRDPDTGAYVRDIGGRLSAIQTLLKVHERLAKMTGVDAPSETVTEAHITYELKGEASPDDL